MDDDDDFMEIEVLFSELNISNRIVAVHVCADTMSHIEEKAAANFIAEFECEKKVNIFFTGKICEMRFVRWAKELGIDMSNIKCRSSLVEKNQGLSLDSNDIVILFQRRIFSSNQYSYYGKHFSWFFDYHASLNDPPTIYVINPYRHLGKQPLRYEAFNFSDLEKII